MFLSTAFAHEEHASVDFPRVKRVNPDELKKMIESKTPDFVAVSSAPQKSLDEAHIPLCVKFLLSRPDQRACKSSPDRDTDPFVVHAPMKRIQAIWPAKLAQFGYRNIKVLDGDILKWMELKHPLEKK